MLRCKPDKLRIPRMFNIESNTVANSACHIRNPALCPALQYEITRRELFCIHPFGWELIQYPLPR